jgi:membrane-bound metal-dependent hydrolase YbcI (DUF457 family)
MATPYGHTLVGLSLLNLWYPQRGFSKKNWLVYGAAILGASFPDLDFIPGLILGQGGRFHHGYFHSVGTAMGAALITGLAVILIPKRLPVIKTIGFVLCLDFSHLLLDFFTEAPKGFPLFWPFTEARLLADLPIFPRVERTWGHPEFWNQALFCFTVETFLFVPLWVTSWRRPLPNKP